MNNAVKILWEEMKNNPDMGCTGGNLYTPERMPCPSFCLRFDDLGTEKRYASWRYLMLSKAEQKLYKKTSCIADTKKEILTILNQKDRSCLYIWGRHDGEEKLLSSWEDLMRIFICMQRRKSCPGELKKR
ncbi:MAG: hypothetical protein ACLRIL_11570 [Fusicatenibacter saccharivorans]